MNTLGTGAEGATFSRHVNNAPSIISRFFEAGRRAGHRSREPLRFRIIDSDDDAPGRAGMPQPPQPASRRRT